MKQLPCETCIVFPMCKGHVQEFLKGQDDKTEDDFQISVNVILGYIFTKCQYIISFIDMFGIALVYDKAEILFNIMKYRNDLDG
jgi:hypothetical protein